MYRPTLTGNSGNCAMKEDKDYNLDLDTSPLNELDEFALLACQEYNFGNTSDWFGTFRGGLHDFNARVHGVVTHNKLVHSWIPPKLHMPVDTEYHVASILFNMDSSIECFTFMLNAFGYAAQPDQFHDITQAISLRKIAPKDIIGISGENTPEGQMEDYAIFFPNLQNHWITSRDFIKTIMDLHNVSKHRETICSGGMLRDDPPKGFFENINVQDDSKKKILLTPDAVIHLKDNPKEPRVNHIPTKYEDRVILEDLVCRFCTFINKSCIFARDDARKNIKLKCNHLRI